MCCSARFCYFTESGSFCHKVVSQGGRRQVSQGGRRQASQGCHKVFPGPVSDKGLFATSHIYIYIYMWYMAYQLCIKRTHSAENTQHRCNAYRHVHTTYQIDYTCAHPVTHDPNKNWGYCTLSIGEVLHTLRCDGVFGAWRPFLSLLRPLTSIPLYKKLVTWDMLLVDFFASWNKVLPPQQNLLSQQEQHQGK